MSNTEFNGEAEFKGYSGAALELLQRFAAPVWSDVTITTIDGEFKGLLLPRSGTRTGAKNIVLKLINGYNIGLAVKRIKAISVRGKREVHYAIPKGNFPVQEGKPKVTLLGTGGTIASRLDYRTGAVIPAFSPAELYSSVPELADTCNLSTRKLYAVFSENMGPEQWIGLAEAVGKEIRDGADGIIIGHGTDTMHHTAAVLSFMVRNTPIPIVLVGSQRSSDRPSSDAALNLACATRAAALGDIAETTVVMFGPTSDEYCLIHRGTRVRKMHSSYRSTFRTIGDIPLGMVDRETLVTFREDYARRRQDREVTIDAVFDDRVAMLYYYPGMKPDVIDSLVQMGYRGIIIAGTGLGHVNRPLYPAIERATAAGVVIFMTVQTIWGYSQMYVYDTGRDLMDLGIVPLDNMLPDTAYMKLGWALGHSQKREDVVRMMITPINGEITEREPFDGYLVYQGGVPEVEEFIRKYHK